MGKFTPMANKCINMCQIADPGSIVQGCYNKYNSIPNISSMEFSHYLGDISDLGKLWLSVLISLQVCTARKPPLCKGRWAAIRRLGGVVAASSMYLR